MGLRLNISGRKITGIPSTPLRSIQRRGNSGLPQYDLSEKFHPCYYLVYVEVLHHFRRLGLGYKILNAFMEFVNDKKAVAFSTYHSS